MDSDSFCCKGSGCCAEEDETHRHRLFWQLHLKSNISIRGVLKASGGTSDYVKVPFGGGLGNGGVPEPCSV